MLHLKFNELFRNIPNFLIWDAQVEALTLIEPLLSLVASLAFLNCTVL